MIVIAFAPTDPGKAQGPIERQGGRIIARDLQVAAPDTCTSGACEEVFDQLARKALPAPRRRHAEQKYFRLVGDPAGDEKSALWLWRRFVPALFGPRAGRRVGPHQGD